MAMIDYGAVVFKNGVCQNSGEFFMDMKKSVGWSDDKSDTEFNTGYQKTAGNFFAYVGDEHLTVAVYKYFCRILYNKKIAMELWGSCQYTPGDSHRSNRFSIDGTNFCLRQISNCGRVYWLQFTYRGDHYNVVYGYGIDPDFKVWDKVKARYLGKKTARKVDGLYKRFKN